MRQAAPHLEPKRLNLRVHRLEDFEACAALWADPLVVNYISGEPSTREQAWADEQLDFDHTVCIFDPQHKASLHVARKSGYRGGGLMAEHKGQPTSMMSRPRYGQDDQPV